MLRSHNCGELRIEHVGQQVELCGWVQRVRDKGTLLWVDLRDRYGITQLLVDANHQSAEVMDAARQLGREYVIKAIGEVIERSSKNDKIPTGEIEIRLVSIEVLNESKTPPFTIEDETDGGEDLRMQYRFLDLRRNTMRQKLELRHKVAFEVRKHMDAQQFLEIETPYLIKSTPEGARDFVVPSRMNAGEFYALPQSPQTFKQLLMVGGYDRYFQIVRCFRDEDLRADRQPEFTQLDCEMAFVTRDDILETFEGLVKSLFQSIKGITLPDFPRMPYAEAMEKYGSDKPDIRFGMEFVDFSSTVQGKGFKVFDSVESIIGICAKGAGEYSRKQLDALTAFVTRPQIGAKGLVYSKHNADGTYKSSVDKFFGQDAQKEWAELAGSQPGDLILLLAGKKSQVQKQLNELRLEMGNQLGLRKTNEYAPLWVVDFPLLELDEETGTYHAMHHPFTSPLDSDRKMMATAPGDVRANAYDMVINGVELGGGSIRIHDRELQSRMFDLLGFTKEEAQAQFGFLMGAFEYGAPPHGGIAFGLDRMAAMFGGTDSIRDYIAFPKNNSGRDTMIDAPSPLDQGQLDELYISLKETESVRT